MAVCNQLTATSAQCLVMVFFSLVTSVHCVSTSKKKFRTYPKEGDVFIVEILTTQTNFDKWRQGFQDLFSALPMGDALGTLYFNRYSRYSYTAFKTMYPERCDSENLVLKGGFSVYQGVHITLKRPVMCLKPMNYPTSTQKLENTFSAHWLFSCLES